MNEKISVSNSTILNQYVNSLKPSNNLNKSKGKTQSNVLNKTVENKNLQKNKGKIDTKYADKVILAKKGQGGYIKEFDLDNDGKISLEEFNKYCEENGIDGKDKVRLLTLMQTANSDEKIAKETLEDTEKSSDKVKNNAIYAKKGDEKYEEAMDENKNGEITYAEYYKYMQEKDKTTKSEEENLNDSQSDFDLSSGEEYVPKKIEPEVQSTVTYEG